MKRIPAIKAVMTPFPYSVDIDAPLSEALRFLQDHNIHHLPVTQNQKLAGVLSGRDIRVHLRPEAGDDVAARMRVRDVYMDHPCIVDLNERLDRVLRMMQERHAGAVLVTRNGRLAGVFTLTDVCRSYADLLRKQALPPSGDDAA
jgi:acetoin utilization protein AcuB